MKKKVLEFSTILSGLYTVYLIINSILGGTFNMEYSASIVIVLIFIGSGSLLILGKWKELKDKLREFDELKSWIKNPSYEVFENKMIISYPGYKEQGFESLDKRVVMMIEWMLEHKNLIKTG